MNGTYISHHFIQPHNRWIYCLKPWLYARKTRFFVVVFFKFLELRHWTCSLLINFCTFSVTFRSSRSEVFLRKGVLKMCFKFTGEHPSQSAISIKLQSSFFWNHTLAWVFSCKFAGYFQNTVNNYERIRTRKLYSWKDDRHQGWTGNKFYLTNTFRQRTLS